MSDFWRHPLCYKIIYKEHGQPSHYVLPSKKNYYGDRVRYLKLFSKIQSRRVWSSGYHLELRIWRSWLQASFLALFP